MFVSLSSLKDIFPSVFRESGMEGEGREKGTLGCVGLHSNYLATPARATEHCKNKCLYNTFFSLHKILYNRSPIHMYLFFLGETVFK